MGDQCGEPAWGCIEPLASGLCLAVLAKDLNFLPMGSQMPDETGCRFAVGQQQMLPQGVQAVNQDILVAKLRPGQAIHLEAHCIKGTYTHTCLAAA